MRRKIRGEEIDLNKSLSPNPALHPKPIQKTKLGVLEQFRATPCSNVLHLSAQWRKLGESHSAESIPREFFGPFKRLTVHPSSI